MKSSTIAVACLLHLVVVNVTDAQLVKMCLENIFPSGHARSDPIINQNCASGHVHSFYGPQNFHPETYYEDIRDTDPRFSTSPFKENQSLYWHPTVYTVSENEDGMTKTYKRAHTKATAYYRWDKSAVPPVEAFPPGFRMIAHSNDAGAERGEIGEGYNLIVECCRDRTQECEYFNYFTFPAIKCDLMEVFFSMPTCWDGKSLGDDNDHKSHMRYTTNGKVNGPCPPGFGRRLPQIELNVNIGVGNYNGITKTYALSDGSSDVYHVDFFNGWQEEKLQEIIDNCPPTGSDDPRNPPCGCTPNLGDTTFLTLKEEPAGTVCDTEVRRLIIDEATDITESLPLVECEGPNLIPRSWDKIVEDTFDTCDPLEGWEEPWEEHGFDEESNEGGSEEISEEGSNDEESEEGSKDKGSEEGSEEVGSEEFSNEEVSEESGEEELGEESFEEELEEFSNEEVSEESDEIEFEEESFEEGLEEFNNEEVSEESNEEEFEEESFEEGLEEGSNEEGSEQVSEEWSSNEGVSTDEEGEVNEEESMLNPSPNEQEEQEEPSVDNNEDNESTSVAFCFSGDNLIKTLNGNYKLMRDLVIGDYVQIPLSSDETKEKYSRIYSMGHLDHARMTKYLQIFYDDNSKPLEITHHHLLFVEGEPTAIAASRVKIGDQLVLSSGNISFVTEIRTVLRKGAYAPLTEAGTMIVSNVSVSCYPTLIENESSLDIHTLSHLAVGWRRWLCSFSYFQRQCNSETYTNQGIATWAYNMMQIANWFVVTMLSSS